MANDGSAASSPATPTAPSVQEQYAPLCACFGCGPANDMGLRLRSFWAADRSELVAAYRPAPHHQAYAGMVNGGVIGALLDCHSNWAAALTLMQRRGADSPPCTVTADFHVKLRRPTPIDATLDLVARAAEIRDDRVVVEATLTAAGHITATCRGTFVAVEPGHPAYHRW